MACSRLVVDNLGIEFMRRGIMAVARPSMPYLCAVFVNITPATDASKLLKTLILIC
jgi:hypothetical protein